MMENGFTYTSYNILDTAITLAFNSNEWYRSFKEYISLPVCVEPENPHIQVSYIICEDRHADSLIPMPENSEKFETGVMNLGYEQHFSVCIIGQQRWVDMPRFGRVRYDYSTGIAHVLRYKDYSVNSLIADEILGYSVLEKILYKAGFFYSHASCVKIGSKGILFTGESGKGKSTAAFALAMHGHPILSDESILLSKRNGYIAVSITDVFKLHRSSMENFFPELLWKNPLFQYEGQSYFKSRDIPEITSAVWTPLDYISIINKTGRPNTYIEEIRPTDLIRELFPAALNYFEPSNMLAKFLFLGQMLKDVKAVRVHFGTDMDDFNEKIEGLLAVRSL